MPAALDRCVLQLRDRGVGESSAYAICTASLQRAGKMPVGRKKEDVESAFAGWSKQVTLPEILTGGMSKAHADFDPSDAALVNRLRKVNLTDREGVLGLARLQSRIIAVNPKGLERLGHKPIWYGAVVLHEAMHAVHGFLEHEATQIEQRYAGRHFGVAKIEYDREAISDTIRVAAMAQGQREIQVHRSQRKNDLDFLTDKGFTPRVARKILRMGVQIGERMMQQEAIREMTQQLGLRPTKQFYLDVGGDIDDWIAKTASVEFHRMLEASLGSDIVEKTSSYDQSVYEPMEGAHANGTQGKAIEAAVVQSIARGVGMDVRGPSGLLPFLRRVGYDVSKLPEGVSGKRAAALRELVTEAAKTGLFRPDGEMTDAHVLMVMHGFSPVWDKLEDVYAQTANRQPSR